MGHKPAHTAVDDVEMGRSVDNDVDYYRTFRRRCGLMHSATHTWCETMYISGDQQFRSAAFAKTHAPVQLKGVVVVAPASNRTENRLMGPRTTYTWPVIGAFAIVYLVWGSTYVANIEAIETIPPSVLIIARLGLAGGILLAVSYFMAMRRTGRLASGADFSVGRWLPSRREFCNAAITGFLFLTVGLGAVVWSEQYIESGTAAVFVAAEPLVVVLVLWAFTRERPRWQAFAGVALGILGTLVLVGQDVVIEGEGASLGIVAIVIAIVAWALGSVLTARLRLPSDRIKSAGLQMALAAILAVPFLWLDDDVPGWTLAEVSERSAWAYGFLVVFGSLIAYSAFVYLLTEVSPEKVATSTYVHPIVALTLGVLIRDEVVTLQTGVACVILLAGVLFVNGNWGDDKEEAHAKAPSQPRQAMSSAVRRRWTGHALPGRGEGLRRFLDEVVVPAMRRAPGNVDARVIVNAEGQFAHEVTVTSEWLDGEALAGFVAGDVSQPKHFDGSEAVLAGEGQVVVHERVAAS